MARFPGLSVAQIAPRLRKDRSTMTTGIKRGQYLLKTDRDFLARYEELKVQL